MFVPNLNFRSQLFCKPMCPYPGLIFSLNSLSYQTLIASPSNSKHPQFENLRHHARSWEITWGVSWLPAANRQCVFFFVALLPLLFRRWRRCVFVEAWIMYGCCSHLGKRMENGGSPKFCDFWYPWRSILFQPWYWRLDILPCRSDSRW